MDQPIVPGSVPELPPVVAQTSAEVARIELTAPMVDDIHATGPWLRFFAIMGFISVGFMAVGGVVMVGIGIVGASLSKDMPSGVMLVGMGVMYALFAVVYILPSLYLFRAAGGVVESKRGEVAGGVAKALANQRSFWKFIGIAMIVMLCLYPVFVVGVLVVTFAAAAR